MINNNNKYYALLVCVVLMTLWYFYKQAKKRKASENGVYTIFYINDIRRGKGVIPEIRFHYFLNGQKRYDNYDCGSSALEFLSSNKIFGIVNPKTLEAFPCCYCEVPRDFSDAPTTGWSYLPIEYCHGGKKKCF